LRTEALVEPYATKSWLFRYLRAGKDRKFGLGSLETTSLARARELAQEQRELLRRGIDPIDHAEGKRAQRRLDASSAMTFKQCADAYIKTNRAAWGNEKHAAQWESTFNGTKAATAAINDLPVAGIDTGLVLKVLQPIWTAKPETASRVRGRIETVLDSAKVSGFRDGENPARWRGHLDHILPKRSKVAAVEHHSAVPYRDMAPFMAELRAKKGTPARALEFAILSAARTGEIIGARWSEVDLDAKLWVVPGERMKAGREHRIPLSERAIAILEALPHEGEIVFPRDDGGKPLHPTSMWEVLRRLRAGATVHGFRSSFRDWAAEQTSYPQELCEIALAHAVGNKVEAAYRRGDMMEKRRRLMDDWAAYCERPPAEPGKVVQFTKSA
jgi:integrase